MPRILPCGMAIGSVRTAWAGLFAILFCSGFFSGLCAAQTSAVFDNITSAYPYGVAMCGYAVTRVCSITTEKAAARFVPKVTSLASDVRIEIGTYPGYSPAFSAEIDADAAGLPGAAVSPVVTGTASVGNLTVATVMFGQPALLQAGTPYWLALSPAQSPTVAVFWDLGGMPTAQSEVYTQGYGNFSWSEIPGDSLQFAVDGTPQLAAKAAQLTNGTAGMAYAQTLSATGGTPPYTWSVSGGALPGGLSLSSNGAITGFPNAAGTFTFTAMVADSGVSPLAQTASQSYTVTMAPASVTLGPAQVLVTTFTTVPNAADLLFFSGKMPLTTTGAPIITAALYDGNTLLGSYTQTSPAHLQVEFESLTSRYSAPNTASAGPPPSKVDFKSFNTGTIAGRLIFTVSGGTINFFLSDLDIYDGVSQSSSNFQAQGDVKETVTPSVGMAATLAPSVDASQTGLTFQAPQGSSSPPPQSFMLINSTAVEVPYTSSISTLSGGSWLSIATGDGTAAASAQSAPITVSVNPSGLAPGDYYGMIQIDAPSAPRPRQIVTVVLNVVGGNTNPGPQITPSGLVFAAVANGSNPAAQPVGISSVSSAPDSFTAAATASSGPPWFTVSPTQGTIAPGETVSLQVQANAATLAAGVYTGTLTLQFPQDKITQALHVVAVVGAGADQACTPTKLLPVFTKVGGSVAVSAAWPVNVEVSVIDDCATAVGDGSVTVTFSNGDVPLTLTALPEGRWSGAWAPLHATSAQVTLSATATDLAGLLGSASMSINLQGNPHIPMLNTGAVVSSASYSSAETPSPGELVAIFGMNLADGPETAQTLPLYTEMQNATLLIDGEAMPLVYVSSGQINAVAPYTVTNGVRHLAIVRHGDRLSAPQGVAFATAEPGIFTTNQTGAGQGHIYIVEASGAQILADSSAPATAGDVLTIYCTGLGPVSPAVVAGTATPAPPPLTQTVNPVSMTIGGVLANVLFAGLAPGYTGLYQINAVVPDGITPSAQAPVVLSVAGIWSPPVTMAVK